MIHTCEIGARDSVINFSVNGAEQWILASFWINSWAFCVFDVLTPERVLRSPFIVAAVSFRRHSHSANQGNEMHAWK